MKKLFLASSFKDVADIFEGFAGNVVGKTVAFIPTASVVEKNLRIDTMPVCSNKNRIMMRENTQRTKLFIVLL